MRERLEAAKLIAQAVVDPAGARRQLIAPRQKLLADGQIALFIEVQVYTPLIATRLINPREGESRQYPVSAAPDEVVISPIEINHEADPAGATLPLLAENVGQVSIALVNSHALLVERQDDKQLQDGIRACGVLEPLTIFPAEISYRRSDEEPCVALLSADGSTRVAYCQLHAGFNPVDAIYR